MKKLCLCFAVVMAAAGCAVTPGSVKRSEPLQEQMKAAKKVVGALSPTGSAVAEKYSPVTGKHYSGSLEFEPGTGVRLIPVEE
ncbi:MAG: hypothetical protein V2A70_03665 [Candidatus Omnitrophota bacterium]